MVIIAFTWAYIVGIELDKLNPIKIKKYGRRAKRLMRYGLVKECCKFSSCN